MPAPPGSSAGAPESGSASRRGEAAAWMTVLAATAVVLVWRLWAPNPTDRLMIGGPDGDFARQFVAYRAWVARSWAELRPPVWNPHQYAGTPGWADPQMAVVYPFRAVQAGVHAVLDELPMWAVDLEVPLHLFLAGAFTFLLTQRVLTGGVEAARAANPGAVRTAAALAASAFMAGGYLTGYPKEQLAVLVTAAWVPAVLWAVSGAVDQAADARTRGRWVIAVAVAVALMVSAGHPQTALYGLVWAAVWAPVRASARARAAGLAWAGIGLGVLLSAVVWLPSATLLGEVSRTLSAQDLLAGFSRAELAQVLLPHTGGRWWPLWVGTIALGLAAAGIALRTTWFWLASAALALAVALGGRLPVLAALFDVVPGLSLFRHHERASVVFSLALAVAAGIVLNDLLTGSPERRQLFGRAFVYAGLAAVVLLAAAPALAGYVHVDEQVAEAAAALWADDLAVVALATFAAGAALWLARSPGRALVAVALLELVAVNKMHGMQPRVEPFPLTPAVAALPDGMPGRVSSEALLPGGANAAMVHRRYDVTGDSPFHLAAMETLQGEVPEIVWWRLLNVAWVATEREFPAGAPVERVDVEGGPPLYRVLVDAPPVWVAPADATAMPPGDPAFDPRGGIDPAASSAVLESFGSLRASATVRLDSPGLAVLSTAYAPGWRASATGSAGEELGRLPVVAAYGALVATPLPAGEWQIRWTYLPGSLILGAAISVLAAVTGGAIWLRTRSPRP